MSDQVLGGEVSPLPLPPQWIEPCKSTLGSGTGFMYIISSQWHVYTLKCVLLDVEIFLIFEAATCAYVIGSREAAPIMQNSRQSCKISLLPLLMDCAYM